MVEVKAGSTVITANKYDGLNRRIVKTTASETRHYYFTNEWQVIEEQVGSTASTARPDVQYVWGPQYVDNLVVRYRDADANGTQSVPSLEEELYSLADANWNVTAATDNAGTVLERFTYTPYGESKVLDASFAPKSGNNSTIAWTHQYTTRELDLETGLQLNRNRFYHQQLGKWVNRDPILYLGSEWNLYEYLNGNPINGLDPYGTGWWDNFCEWLWNTTSSVGAPPTVGALEGAPDGAEILTITELRRIAMEQEAKFGPDSKEARKAWERHSKAVKDKVKRDLNKKK